MYTVMLFGATVAGDVFHHKIDHALEWLNRWTEFDFFGEIYATSGHKPGQSKVSAITGMPAPTCKKQVQSFIAMISYLSKFSPRLSELVELIRELPKDKSTF